MATITALDISSGAHADHWCLNITAMNASTAAAIRPAETGKRHGLSRITVAGVSAGTQWFKILNGADVLIGPVILATGVVWSHAFDRTTYGSTGNALSVQTQSDFKIHLLVDGVTDAYPGQASSPSPADEATGISTSTSLSWSSGTAISYDIYLGTDETNVLNANTGSAEYTTTQSGTTYSPSGLQASTTYYWRVDVYDGATAKGNVWSFTTA